MCKENFKVRLHYVMPKHLLTRMVGFLASAKMGKFTTWLIQKFIELYHVNTYEMYGNIEDYATFNEFFSRPLKKNARPIDESLASVVFPSDGTVSQFGDLIENVQIQAKGHYFSIETLLGDEKDANMFKNGQFCTVYLSPSDYHRVHIPFAGKLLKMTHIPGELFSVNPTYVNEIPELFSRNERVVCLFETEIGKMAVIMVGATIVRSIVTAWEGVVAPNKAKEIFSKSYNDKDIIFSKGEEIGRFMMGSTVICLFEKDILKFSNALRLEQHVLMGTTMATAQIAHPVSNKAKIAQKKLPTVKKTSVTKKK